MALRIHRVASIACCLLISSSTQCARAGGNDAVAKSRRKSWRLTTARERTRALGAREETFDERLPLQIISTGLPSQTKSPSDRLLICGESVG